MAGRRTRYITADRPSAEGYPLQAPRTCSRAVVDQFRRSGPAVRPERL